jgi:hypothetical protein
LDVIVVLAHHSPAASEFVMKCPRLVDSIIHRFILVSEDHDDGIHSAQSCRMKAIKLLQVELKPCKMISSIVLLRRWESLKLHSGFTGD